jgi:hypothetical protein
LQSVEAEGGILGDFGRDLVRGEGGMEIQNLLICHTWPITLIRLHCVEGGGGEGDRGMRELVYRTGLPNRNKMVEDINKYFFIYLFALGGSPTPHPISLPTSFCR